MAKGTINARDIRFVHSPQPFLKLQKEPLFTTSAGDNIVAGDMVEFDVYGDVFPHGGTISTIKGVRVECFNIILNKWEYYNVAI